MCIPTYPVSKDGGVSWGKGLVFGRTNYLSIALAAAPYYKVVLGKTPLLPSALKRQDHLGLCFTRPEASPTLLPNAEEVTAVTLFFLFFFFLPPRCVAV